ncbi:MAG: M20 family metallopeptidase [Bacillota bacterium]|nr:M20 family metallopeptidase [Bacillota bacterium]
MSTTDFYTEEEVVKLAQNLVRIPSHKDVPGREREIGKYIYNYCRDNGLEVAMQDVEGERKNVLIYLRGEGKGKTLLLNGHTDTIPPYNMNIEPFKGQVKDGYLWGRGSVEMKGAIASMITALIALKRKGEKLQGDVIISAVVGEEEKSEGTETLVQSGIKADGAIVGKPSDYNYAVGHRGLEWLKITFYGKAVHGGVTDEGRNAILMAADFITEVEKKLYPKISKRFNKYMGQSDINIGRIEGGHRPSTVADKCTLMIDRRYIDGESISTVVSEIREIINDLKEKKPGFDAKVERMEENIMSKYYHFYHYTNPDTDIVRKTIKVLKENIGKEPQMTIKGGWTDAATLSYYGRIPTVITRPGNFSYSHTAYERIPIKDLYNYVKIYAEIAEEFCGEKIQV